MNKYALTVENLTKVYSVSKNKKENKALNNLNFQVKQGEVFGLLGPNGAGKTTFLSILGGTVTKTEGRINVWGFDIDKNPRQVRASIGIVPQELNLDPFFSPRKLLELQAGMYGVKKKDRITDTILKIVSLDNQSNSYSRGLSGGMKRRLMIAKALVHQPPIVILDEPTAGVDVELRQQLWENVKLLNKNGVTIILTTHYLNEAEEMCDRIGILNKGKLVALDSTQNLLNKINIKKVRFKLSNNNSFDRITLKSLSILKSESNELVVSYDKNKLTMNEIIEFLTSKSINILDISTDDGDLEDVFISLTNN